MAAILRVKDENGNIVSIPAIKGDKGEKGDKGDRGLPGSGGVPDGGTTGQVLTKNSNADGDAGWKDAVQADWNENDEGSPAFVKNRTHYTEYENQLQFDYNEDRNFYTITSSTALDTDKTYELVFDYDIENDAGGNASTLIKYKVINPVTYKGSWVGKFAQKTKYGSTFWCFNDIHPADNSALPCIYSSDMKTFTGYINGCVNDEAWLNEVKIAAPLDLKYIPETIARTSDTVMGTGEEQHFGSAVEEQICSNIGALYRDDLNGYLSDKVDKNQGTANSGKFLGIGADGIVVPTEVGGSEWTELYQGTIEVPEPVSSLTVDLVKSCEGMTEAVMSFTSIKGEGELTGNTSMHCKFGLFGVTYGRLGNYSAECDDKYYLLAPNKYQSMFYKNSKSANSIYFNTSQCLTGWVEPSVLSNPNYNQMIIDFWGSPGYQGKITLRIVGR